MPATDSPFSKSTLKCTACLQKGSRVLPPCSRACAQKWTISPMGPRLWALSGTLWTCSVSSRSWPHMGALARRSCRCTGLSLKASDPRRSRRDEESLLGSSNFREALMNTDRSSEDPGRTDPHRTKRQWGGAERTSGAGQRGEDRWPSWEDK